MSICLCVALVFVPAASAAASPIALTDAAPDSGPVEDMGFKQCRNTLGYNICVGVMYRGCTFWFSFGLGGCMID